MDKSGIFFFSTDFSIYICVCVCVYTHTHINLYRSVCVHVCIYACMYVYMHVCIYVCMYINLISGEPHSIVPSIWGKTDTIRFALLCEELLEDYTSSNFQCWHSGTEIVIRNLKKFFC